MKRARVLSGIAIGLIAVSFVASYLQPSPLEIAQQRCTEQGFAADKIALLGYRGSEMPIAASETVEFQVKGAKPPKKLVVELRQPVYFLPWRVVEFREEAAH